jgi:Transposase DDE domain
VALHGARTEIEPLGNLQIGPMRTEQRQYLSLPKGQWLPWRKTKYTEAEVVYRADAATCNACPVKPQCTASDHGRIVHRSFYEDYLDKVRGYHLTDAYKKAMRKRKVWVEPLFAEAKEWHGLRRLRLRGLENANIQGLLIATGQNLKRLLAATGWGRRFAPCGTSRRSRGGSQSPSGDHSSG